MKNNLQKKITLNEYQNKKKKEIEERQFESNQVEH